MAEERFGQALPTVTGYGARLAIAALKTHNVDIAALLRRAGLSQDDFDSRRHSISTASQFKLFEYAAEVIRDSVFGLHLAEGANPREAGALFYVMSAANDVGEALTLFGRYSRIVNEALHVKLVRAPAGVVVETGFIGLPRYSAKQATEFGVALAIKALRYATSLGRDRGAKTSLSRQGGETERRQDIGPQRANALAQTGRGGRDLRAGCRSVAAKPSPRIRKGTGDVARADCVAARL